MKLLMITQYFDPEVFRGNDIAYYLAEKGVEVTVITGTPNYPEGRFRQGYGWFKRVSERKKSVKIIRVPIIPRGKNSLMLILNYFTYAINASIFVLFYLIKHKFDACFVQQLSPVMMSLPGVLFKKLTKKPLYTWVLDLWPESLQSVAGINNKYILKFFEWFAKKEYENSDVILTSSKSFIEVISKKGHYGDKLMYFPQWADAEINDKEINLPELPDGFKIIFAGNVGEAQDFENIIEVVKMIGPEEGVKFIIIGEGRKLEWVKEQIEKYNLGDRVFLMGRYAPHYMSAFYSQADLMLVSLKDDYLFSLTVPAKVQSYLSEGKPIIAMINGECNELIKSVGCGRSVAAGDVSALVNEIRSLKQCPKEILKEMGERGRAYYNENFNKEKCLKKFYNLVCRER